jgi:glycosyltransferase involved in cell wall biosynthesis
VSKLLWICPTWTPYNDFFFRKIHAELPGRFEVVYLHNHFSAHPWKTREIGDYPSCHIPGGVAGIPRLLAKAKATQPTAVVLAGWNYPGVLMLAAHCALVRCPYAVWTDTPRERQPGIRREWRRDLVLKLLLGGATRVWGTGYVAMQRLKELGASAERVRDLPYFVDLDLLRRPSSDARMEDFLRPIRIVSCGRLQNNQKGYDRALAGIARLRELTTDPFIYQLIGDGPDRAQLEAQVVALGLQDCVQMLGWRDPSEIAQALRDSDLFLHPSSFDPFAVVILEAMAAGAIVVASPNALSVKSRVRDHRNGYLLASTDSDCIAATLHEAIADRIGWPKMRQAARAVSEKWGVAYGLGVVREFLTEAEGPRPGEILRKS